MGYFWIGVVIGIIAAFFVFILIILPAFLIAVIAPSAPNFVLTPLIIIGSYIMARLSPALAAYALDDKMTIQNAMNATRSHQITFIMLGIIYAVILFISNYLPNLTSSPLLMTIYDFIMTLVAIAVITASYEFLTKDRE